MDGLLVMAVAAIGAYFVIAAFVGGPRGLHGSDDRRSRPTGSDDE